MRGVFLLPGLLPAVAGACLVLGPADLVTERALIEWDPATKTERFTREAAFDSGGEALFLVPTPSRPVVRERKVDWRELSRELNPPREPTRRYDFVPLWDLSRSFLRARYAAKAMATGAAPAFRIVGEGRSGAYDYTIYRADDPAAFAARLAKVGFPGGERLTRWLRPYVGGDWHVTAFRLRKDASEIGGTELTFRTDRPFYPYREPEGAGYPGRSLYLVAPTGLGDDGYGVAPTYRAPWQGKWLTAYLDNEETRPPRDLDFREDGRTVRPAPVTDPNRVENIPVGTPTLAVLLGGWLFARRARRKG